MACLMWRRSETAPTRRESAGQGGKPQRSGGHVPLPAVRQQPRYSARKAALAVCRHEWLASVHNHGVQRGFPRLVGAAAKADGAVALLVLAPRAALLRWGEAGSGRVDGRVSCHSWSRVPRLGRA